MNADTLLAELASKLKSHDWYFMYSDDGNVYRRGVQQFDEIGALMAQAKSVGAELRAKTLFESYRPRQ
jgi:hypothetical protein